ncbi:MAG: hypothetical protein Q7V57_13830 [Actinomycetota bacterium]|nr:hypothetical protein [Actinomycetota bacterium]
MKARIATVLSLAGVLSAGSAAALVNQQVLRDTESATPGRSVDSIVQSQFPSNVVVEPGQQAPAATQAVYLVGTAGAVTLDIANDALTVVDVVANDGWTVVSAESEDPGAIEVTLRSGTAEVEFHAALIFGVVNTSFETKDLAPTTTAHSAPPITTGGPVPTTPEHDDGEGSGPATTTSPTTTTAPSQPHGGDDNGDDDDDDGDDDHESDDD